MKYAEFYDRLAELLCGQQETIPTERYLRQLLRQVLLQQKAKPTLTLFLQLFNDAFSGPPLPMEDHWYRVQEPILLEPQAALEENDMDGFAYTVATLQFFIADLVRMEHGALKNPLRGLGLTSPSGARWNNFTLCAFVEAAASYFEDTPQQHEKDLSWYDLACIFVIGKMYE